MSFSWANLNLAKQALKNAQKKIDSVLDIHEDDEGEGSSTPINEEDDTFVEESESSPVVSEQPSGVFTDHVDARSEAATSECEHWSREWRGEEKKTTVVVDAEPNPIHDVVPHSSSALLNHSPNSSPDEAENEDHTRSDGQESVDETVSIPPPLILDDPSFSSIPLNSPPHDVPRPSLSRRSSRHEDQMTVASSDIEVIRNIDAWSMTSSAVKVPAGIDQSVVLPTLRTSDSIDTLKGQLRHHEQRIEELTVINQKLQETNGQLQQRIVALNQIEKAQKKEIAEKEAARLEILEEGKKMSDYSGKQSREIRRLKAQVEDVDKIKAERKKYKDEKNAAEETIDTLNDEIESLNSKIQSLERALQEERSEKCANELASEHHKNQNEENARRIAELEQKNIENEEIIANLKQNKEAIEQKFSSLTENELERRLASDRANETVAIANEELVELRRANDQMRTQLSDCQRKLDQAIEGRNRLVESVAKANTPLLAEIEELKSALIEERNTSDDHDNIVRGLKKRLDDATHELSRLTQSLNAANERSSSEQAHLLHRISKLEGHQANLIASHSAQLESEREEKRLLIVQLKEERKTVDDLKEECDAIRAVASNLESAHSALREQLSEYRERSIERSEEEFGDVTDLTTVSQSSPVPRPSQNSIVELPSTPTFQYSFGSTMTHGETASQSEMSSLLRNHNLSMRQISDLESKMRRCEEAIQARDVKIKEWTSKYKELDFQYNSLLEIDGERLEKIEELQNDIDDLRQLMKDQLIAFAEARSREEEADY